MGKNESVKFGWALLLFISAVFFYGIKNFDVQQKKEAVRLFTQGLVDTIKFANSLGLPKVRISFDVGKNNDNLSVDFVNRKVTSERNFIYHYNGYTVKCTVSFHKNMYIVACETE
jgi:hypothetical protein